MTNKIFILEKNSTSSIFSNMQKILNLKEKALSLSFVKPISYIVIGDVHIHPDRPVYPHLQVILEQLLHRLKKRERLTLVINGDFFDFTLLSGAVFTVLPVIEALDRLDKIDPKLFDMLADIVKSRGRIVFLAGNHDQELYLRSVQEKIKQLFTKRDVKPLQLNRVTFPSWFFQPKGLVHVEHGSQYDSDNAVIHPLLIDESSNSVAIYPLGVVLGKLLRNALGEAVNELSLRFDQYGMKAIIWVMQKYKWRFIKMYFAFISASENIVKLSKKHSTPNDSYISDKQNLYAEKEKVPLTVLQSIREVMATPTIIDPVRTRERLYLNRMYLSFLALLLIPSWFLAPFLMFPIFGVSLIPLVQEIKRQNKFTTGEAERQMQQSATNLLSRLTVKLVVFSHIHRTIDNPGYCNTGSLELPKKGERHSCLEFIIRGKKVTHKMLYVD